jgi:hypothetical protein
MYPSEHGAKHPVVDLAFVSSEVLSGIIRCGGSVSLQGRADVLEDEVLLDDAFILAAMSDTDSQNAIADLE